MSEERADPAAMPTPELTGQGASISDIGNGGIRSEADAPEQQAVSAPLAGDSALRMREIELEHTYRLASVATKEKMYHLSFMYAIGGLILGGLSMLFGSVLFLAGAVGKSSWTAKLLGAESSITDAGPGAVLFIVGVFIVFSTRLRAVRLRTSRGSETQW